MSQFQAPISIRDALEKIRRNELAMPAIQRDYEWDPGRIAWLFDSLMREYPVSSFLLWEVRGENIQNYKFYSFLRYMTSSSYRSIGTFVHVAPNRALIFLDIVAPARPFEYFGMATVKSNRRSYKCFT